MQSLTDLFKILSDETRLRILNLLLKKELCVCELVDILSLSQPKISKHIAKIREVGLVKSRRDEQFILYSINHDQNEYESILKTIFEQEYHIFKEDNDKLTEMQNIRCAGE